MRGIIQSTQTELHELKEKNSHLAKNYDELRMISIDEALSEL